MSERPKLKCPKCKGHVERLISGGAGIIFKGSGFYATDYRSDGYKSSAKADHTKAEPPAPAKPAAEKKKKSSKN